MPCRIHDPGSWPASGNPEGMALGRRQWRDRAAGLEEGPDRRFAADLPETPVGRALFDCIFGSSPFLGMCMVREQPHLRKIWEEGPGAPVAREISRLREVAPGSERQAVARLLRVTRRRVALAIALADISGHWDLEAVTAAQTELAEASCSAAFRVLLAELGRRGALALPDPDRPEEGSGLIALGMGKLGGRELNFSSDIDLILLYDPEVVPAARRYEVPFHLMKLAQSFIALLSEPTVDGTAFRVDLRLRPDPVSTPLVMSTKAALDYYGKRGQTWERAALIKARPVAADVRAGAEFLRRLETFVWRQRLDFATVQDLHDIKRRIDAQHKGGDIGSRGQDIKLGRGGIREIEFFVQTHQLVWGGTDRSLRTIATCASLEALTAAGHIPQPVTDALADSYRYLRRVEHRIQMVADNQTHSLPVDTAEFEALARFLGYRDSSAFSRDLTAYLRQVERQYEQFFELPREMFDAGGASVLAGASQGETAERLARMGFESPGRAARIVRNWHTGGVAAASDPRALDLLRSLVPSLAIAACGTEEPDVALERIDAMIHGLLDGTRAFTLLQANLHVMESVSEILVASPAIGTILTECPDLLEDLLAPAMDAYAPGRKVFEAEVADTLAIDGGESGWSERLGDWVGRVRFRLAAQVLYRSLDPIDAARSVSDLADCLLAVVLAKCDRALAAEHGRPAQSGAALVAVGGLAGRDFAIGDSISAALLFHAPSGATTPGPRPIPARSYYSQLASSVHSGLARTLGRRLLFLVGDRLHARPVSEWSGWLSGTPASFAPPRIVASTPGASSEVVRVVQSGPLEVGEPTPVGAPRAGPGGSDVIEWDGEDLGRVLTRVGLAARALLEREGVPVRAAASARAVREALRELNDRGGAGQDAARLALAWEAGARLHSLERLLGRSLRSGPVPASLLSLVQTAGGANQPDQAAGSAKAAITSGLEVADRVLAPLGQSSGPEVAAR